MPIATGNPADRGKFKTTSLRNAAVRGPYFHNGRTNTLHDVVLFYERGGDFFDNIDPLMTPFTLSTQERDDLVDFLANGLLDPRVPLEQAPFDRPTLHSEVAPNPEFVGVGSQGSGGATPLMISSTPPMIGRYTSATSNEADSTKISVTGSIPMNCPGTPGQNSIGRKAQSVVAVELTTGQNIRLAAST